MNTGFIGRSMNRMITQLPNPDQMQAETALSLVKSLKPKISTDSALEHIGKQN